MKSRFLNISPRAYIRQKDSVNVLPRIVRTGYQNEKGESSSVYNERDLIIFSDNSRVIAPYMVPSRSAASLGFLTGTLLLTASIKDRSSYLEKAVAYDSIFPYKEGGNPAAFNDTEDDGFPESEYPSFSSPDSDKSAITIDISSQNDAIVTKLSKARSLLDTGGEFYNEEYSGFLYYNKELREWKDVGLEDPATGDKTGYDPVLSIDHVLAPGVFLINGKDDKLMCQFSSSPYSFLTEDPFIPDTIPKLESRGYHKIGDPTAFFGAPYSPRYHAKKDFSISLSDYISSPFVIDRISVKLPVRALRTQSPPILPGAVEKDNGSARDIENYVFFVYAQNRSNAIPDSVNDVSSSIRHLIGKQSFCFYNSQTFETMSPFLPRHSFGFSHNFNMLTTVASSSKTVETRFFDTELNLTFRPRTYDYFFGTTSKIPVETTGGPTTVSGSVFIQHFWRGGQISSGSYSEIIKAQNTAARFNQRRRNRPNINNLEIQTSVSPRSIIRSCWEGSKNLFVTGSGLGLGNDEVTTCNVDSNSSIETPVILFPNDELVFGIESGVNANLRSALDKSGIDSSFLDVTGSRLVIRAGDAQITLYGSMIREGKEVLPSLNQFLGSDAIHEDIHETGPFDEFDILDKNLLSASYVDGVFTGGSLLSGTRRRTSLASVVTPGIYSLTASLQRNVKFRDEQAFYYDTFIPSSEIIVTGLQNSELGLNNEKENAIKLTADATNGYVVNNSRNSDTMLVRPFVFEKESGQARQRQAVVNIMSAGSYAQKYTGDESRFALYYNGRNPSIDLTAYLDKNYTGAASLRYGLMNVRLTNPSSVFRRDKFGQLRDMLEQSRNSKIVTAEAGKDVVGVAAVTALFVSQSSNTQISPSFTQCSNLSFECTSSVPFVDDGQVHNRGPLPESIIKFGPNNLIFGVTGSIGF